MTNLFTERFSQACRARTSRYSALLVLSIAALSASSRGHADPADFAAMPGLWKTTFVVIDHGKAGKPTIKWHCVVEDEDPWIGYANLALPGAQCQRSNQQRTSTALAWNTRCSGTLAVTGNARVEFDSAEHYTGGITDNTHGEVLRVEGKRYAACTSPND